MMNMQLFNTEEQKKAITFTTIFCFILLLLFIFFKWTSLPIPEAIIQDQIEINLGNNEDGFGDEQPLVKGNSSLSKNNKAATSSDKSTSEKIETDELTDVNAASIVNAKNNKTTQAASDAKATAKKPKLTYTGPNKNANGNNPDVDNNYKYQGNNPNKKGDNNDPSGNKDSYGNTPGGKIGGPKVTKGNRTIIKQYKFEGELNKATIYAIIKVSASGEGKFTGFDKGTTNRNQSYANAVSSYLRNIQFNKSDLESTVTVQFVFDIN